MLTSDFEQKKKQRDEVIHGYKINSEVTFYNTLNQPAIINILQQAQNASPEKIAELHTQLYELLKDKYHNLKTISNVRQLHFHLPDGRSFLRMHRPNKYGDNLFNFRESVKITNQQKIISQGFEEGRIFNGYRFVYPIIHQQQHLGSVEISISLSAILDSLQTIYGGTYCFLLDTDIIGQKVFKSETNNYTEGPFGQGLSVDKGVQNPSCSLQNFDIRTLADNKDVQQNLAKRISFSETIDDLFTLNHAGKVAHFIPIKNFKEQKVAYIYTIDNNQHFISIHSRFIYNLAVAFAIFLFFIGLVFYAGKRQQKLVEQKHLLEVTVKERTLKYEVLLHEQNYIKDVLETIFSVVDHLNRLGKVEKLLYESCENLTHNDHYRFAHIHFFKGELSVPISVSALKEGLKANDLIDFYEELESTPSFTTLLKYGELSTLDNLSTKDEAEPIKDFLESRNINHAVFIPLRNNRDKTYGYLSLFTSDSQSLEERLLLKKLGMTISQSLNSLKRRDNYEHALQEKIADYKRMIFSISQSVEKRYPTTQGHDLRVSKLARMIAHKMGLEKTTILALGEAGMLHDIGKLGLSDALLNKPGALTKEEQNTIQAQFLHAVDEMAKLPYLKKLAEIIRFCREHEDGTGYLRVKGNRIPLESKILSIASAFDAMTHERVYKPKLSVDEAIAEITKLKGKQFDAEVAELAIPVFRFEAYKNNNREKAMPPIETKQED